MRLKQTLIVTAWAVMAGTGSLLAQESGLGDTVIWTTYGTGTTGYNQAVAVGSALKNKEGVNLRLLPGKNDISRMAPLRAGKAQFSATGSDGAFAQEAIYAFGRRDWGPQPVRVLLQNIGDGCTPTFSVAGDIEVNSIQDLRGKRVGFVKASPGLEVAGKALLAFGGLTYDDVELVEFGGYTAAIDGLIAGTIDAQVTSTQSGVNTKIAGGPRGLQHIPLPADDTEGWARLQDVVPYYQPTTCRTGAGVPEGGMPGSAAPFPILLSMADTDADIAYSMTKAMYEHFDDYKDGAPDARGWAADRQNLEGSFVPFHEGAVRYYKEAGKWTDEAEANQQKQLARQKLVQDTWSAYIVDAPTDDEEFMVGWAAARAKALEEAGLPVIAKSW